MTELLKTWLKEQLIHLVNVKRCTFTQDTGIGITDPPRRPDLIVHLWTGIHTHIHLLDHPLNTRTIRRIVEGATRIGVGSLFIVDTQLLPRNNERVTNDQWFMALHALSNRLYAYKLEGDNPIIGEVHFTSIGRTVELETHYGAKIAVRELRCFSHSVKSPLIKGYWMVADFGADASKKPSPAAGPTHTDYERLRRQQYQPPPPSSNGAYQAPPTSRGASSNGPASANGSSTRPAAPKSKLDTCCDLLGVKPTASREDVKAAFRKLAFEVHPDVSDLPKAEAELRFKLLTEAYEYIKTSQGWE